MKLYLVRAVRMNYYVSYAVVRAKSKERAKAIFSIQDDYPKEKDIRVIELSEDGGEEVIVAEVMS